MSSADEFEFAEFSEEDLRTIDSVADAAFASDPVAWPQSSSSPGLTTNLENTVEESLPPRSRKSSGFSVFDLTEEELRLLDESVARLGSDNGDEVAHEAESDDVIPPEPTRLPPPHIEIVLELPAPSTLAPSPAPTLGRTPTPPPTFTLTPSATLSLYAKFRLYRNSLSVSDLVGPSWCEVQFDYGLRGGRGLPVEQRPTVFMSRTGKSIAVRKEIAAENEAVMKKGTAVHKKLEREIRPIEITVTTTTREDRWGLKLLNMLSNIRILIDDGCCREMPVMGFIHGHFVLGVIDEIICTTPIPPSPSCPGGFSSSNETSPSPCNTINIIDNKTRAVPSKPKAPDTLPSRLQLMLYKRLLDALLQLPTSESPSSARFSFHDVWDHHAVDPCARFSPQFLEESAVLVLDNRLGQEALQARCLRDLESVWEAIIRELGAGGGEAGAVSKTLKLVYRLRGGGTAKFRKRSAKSSGSSSDTSETQSQARNGSFVGSGMKKARGESEEVDEDLQRAIHASLASSSGTGGGSGLKLSQGSAEVQEGAAEVIQEEEKDEESIIRGSERVGLAPGAWVPSDDEDIQRAIRDSIRSYKNENGIDVSPSPSPPPVNIRDPRRKRESDEGIIGTVEFEHDNAFLEEYLSNVLDFWHNRRSPNGVTIEDTRRCSYCEFADSCEWLETKAAELTPRPRSPRRTPPNL